MTESNLIMENIELIDIQYILYNIYSMNNMTQQLDPNILYCF